MQYLSKVLNGRTVIPIKQWAKEAAEIDADHATMYAEYTQLRTEVQNAESILRCVKQVSKETPLLESWQPKRDTEL